MALRFCLPRVSRQGHGLGNELVPWARAFLAAQVLDATLLAPASPHGRGHWRDRYGAPGDWIYRRAIERLVPRVEFNEAHYLEYGGGDVVPVLRRFAHAQRLQRRSMFVLVTEGVWGGLHHVRAARGFLRSTLYRSRGAGRDLLRLRQRIDPEKILIAMDMGRGYLEPPAAGAANHGSASLCPPREWYQKVAHSLRAALGTQLQFLVVGDARSEPLRSLLDIVPCITTADAANAECSDVLALADADLLVSSGSHRSDLAAFFSDAPYVCFAQHGQSPSQQGIADAGARAIGIGLDGSVPPSLIERLRRGHACRCRARDLVRGGVIAGPEAPGSGH